MEFWLGTGGLGLCIFGSLLVAIGDAWLSRSMLVYLDAVESNVSGVVKALKSGVANPDVTAIDLRRDRGQNRARALKTLGWFTLIAGFASQLAILVLKRAAL